METDQVRMKALKLKKTHIFKFLILHITNQHTVYKTISGLSSSDIKTVFLQEFETERNPGFVCLSLIW